MMEKSVCNIVALQDVIFGTLCVVQYVIRYYVILLRSVVNSY